jgi:hypothetical protein
MTTTLELPAVAGAPSKARTFQVPCVVRVTLTPEEVSAHVELAGGVDVGPGDRVHVHGAPIHPRFGQSLVEHRVATVTRASAVRRWWTRVTGDLACMELLDVSFTDRRTL